MDYAPLFKQREGANYGAGSILKDENIDENNEQKKIEVITGDGDLNISPVYDHIEVEKPKPKDTREVIVPEVKDTVNKADTTE